MKTKRIALIAAGLSMAGISSGFASPLGPPTPAPMSAIGAGVQSQTNASAYITLPTISSIIQQSLRGFGTPGTRNALGSPTRTGMGASADSESMPIQAWFDANGGSARNSLAIGGYNLTSYGPQAGLQAQITPKLVVGLGVSWLDTAGSLSGGFTSHAITVGATPYIGWQFDDHWNVSAIAGYSSARTGLRNTTLAYGADYTTDQWTFQGALNGSYTVDKIKLLPMVSFLHTGTNNRAFVDSNGTRNAATASNLDRGSVGGSVSLPLTGWEPYVRAAGEYDFTVPTGSKPNGNAGATIGAGATITLSDSTSLSLDGGYNSLGRAGLALWSGDVRVSIQF